LFHRAGLRTDPDVSRAAGGPSRGRAAPGGHLAWSAPARRTVCGYPPGLTIIWADLFTGCA